MRRFNIDFFLEPFGRYVNMEVEARWSWEALTIAILRLELEAEEELHSIHIGRGVIVDMQESLTAGKSDLELKP